ncbi:MAG: VWA domain-containing protein [Spirochaetaceae bacterium]
MITFENPVMLIILAMVPTMIYLRHFWPGRGGRIPFSFTVWQKEVLPAPALGVRFILFLTSLFFWIGFVALLAALAGPSLTERERVYLTRGIDIMVVLDQSPSMAAQDFAPENRFSVAKRVVRDFIDGRENDSIGLVGFGTEAVLRAPPTKDYNTLKERLEDLRVMELGKGTAIGMGLALACVHLQESTADQQIVLLITDGDNNAGEVTPSSATRIASEMGVRVYTIGVGGDEEVPIELEDPETGRTIRGKIRESYDEELLSSTAEATGGRFFSASNSSALRTVINDIDALETVEQRVRVKTNTLPIHRSLIITGFVLVLLSFFVRKFVFREVI